MHRNFGAVKTSVELIGTKHSGEVGSMGDWRQTRLDHAITATVLGFFASAWFGWAHAGVTSGAVWLDIGSGLALLVAIAAVITAFRVPWARAAARHPEQRRRYGITVGIEFALIALGAVVLGASGAPRWLAVWVLAVVGVHFIPLAPTLNNRMLYPLGILTCVAALVALIVALASTLQPATIAGIGGGIALGGFAGYDLFRALRGPGTA
jgi:hypothetical protein